MLIPMLSIHPSRITAYMQSTERYHGVVIQKRVGAEMREYTNGQLSRAARKRLYEAITALCAISNWKTVYSKRDERYYRFKLSFITLTLPINHSLTDKEATQLLLSKFLEAWNRRSVKILYVWKAEVTDNGTIHYHITTNTYIHYQELRERWNKMLCKKGIIDKDRIATNNSTDVHSVKKMRNIAAYLTSYVTKKDLYKKALKRWLKIWRRQLADPNRTEVILPKNYFKNIKRKIECQLWGCSKVLLKTKLSDCFEGTELERELNNNEVLCGRMIVTDYFSTCYVKADEWANTKEIKRAWNKMMTERLKEEKKNNKVHYRI